MVSRRRPGRVKLLLTVTGNEIGENGVRGKVLGKRRVWGQTKGECVERLYAR